jgi:hypothetical protein
VNLRAQNRPITCFNSEVVYNNRTAFETWTDKVWGIMPADNPRLNNMGTLEICL